MVLRITIIPQWINKYFRLCWTCLVVCFLHWCDAKIFPLMPLSCASLWFGAERDGLSLCVRCENRSVEYLSHLLKHQELPETSWQRAWTGKKLLRIKVRVVVFIKANMINTELRQPKMVSLSFVEPFNNGKHLFSQLWIVSDLWYSVKFIFGWGPSEWSPSIHSFNETTKTHLGDLLLCFSATWLNLKVLPVPSFHFWFPLSNKMFNR